MSRPGSSICINQVFAPYGLRAQTLRCPADSRLPADDFAALNYTNISYFASLDAGVSNKSLFVSGDRNLIINGKPASPELATVTTTTTLNWSKELHYIDTKVRRGNILFPDGHVEATTEQSLPALITAFGTATNRLVFP